ncbi:acyltransferase domain-containing protein [Micromonospora sp. M12]
MSARARLMEALPAGGAMVAVEASEAEVAGLPVAAVNGPTSVVISGPVELVEDVAARWRARGRRVQRLNVSHAFHSAQMEPMLAEFGEVAAGIRYERPTLAVISNVTGEPVRDFSADYWVRHVRATVRFGAGLDLLTSRGVSVFVEVGPDGCCPARARRAVRALVAARPGRADTALSALARVHLAGVRVNWPTVLAGGRAVPLPTYAFQRERHWLRSGPAATPRTPAGTTASPGRPCPSPSLRHSTASGSSPRPARRPPSRRSGADRRGRGGSFGPPGRVPGERHTRCCPARRGRHGRPGQRPGRATVGGDQRSGVRRAG